MVEHLIAAAPHVPHALAMLDAALRSGATTTTTKAGKSSSNVVHVSSGVLFLIVAAEFAVGAGIAYFRRKRRGIYPWRMHPALWGLIFVITQGIGLAVIIFAWFFTPTATDPNEPPGRRPFRYPGQPGTSGPPLRSFGRTPRGARTGTEVERPRFEPGTYGTSLPPPARMAGTATLPPPDEEEAGWMDDPTGRHDHRYWNGSRWTKHVADRGERSTDPI